MNLNLTPTKKAKISTILINTMFIILPLIVNAVIASWFNISYIKLTPNIYYPFNLFVFIIFFIQMYILYSVMNQHTSYTEKIRESNSSLYYYVLIWLNLIYLFPLKFYINYWTLCLSILSLIYTQLIVTILLKNSQSSKAKK